jgi:hypothetical protein
MSYFLSGVPYILWDNIVRGTQISCPHIEKSCTAAYYSDRKLGVSQMHRSFDHPPFHRQQYRTARRPGVAQLAYPPRRGPRRPRQERRSFHAAHLRSDGTAGTRHDQLLTPGLEVRRLFDFVRDDVMEATGRKQKPFSYGSISGRQDFYFVAGK